jgi:hypothetical protein
MAPITESFLTQVQDAICAEVLRLCGSGPDAYAEPDYLQLQAARRGSVAQGFDVTPEEMPAYVIEYIYSDETGPGGQTYGGDYTHVFNAAALAELTAAGMGYAEPWPTRQEFRTAVEASADVLTRRIHRAMRHFAPTVLDEEYGETSTNVKVGLYRFVLRELDALAYSVQILFEVMLPAEDLTF